MTFRPVPKPVFKKNHMVTDVPESVKREVIERSIKNHAYEVGFVTEYDRERGFCEGKDCPNRRGDHRGLTWAHRYVTGQKNKGMGGTRRVPTANDCWRGCFICHNREDHHLC